MRPDRPTKTLRDAHITQASYIITSKEEIKKHNMCRYYIYGGRDLSNGALSSIWCADISSISKIQSGQLQTDSNGWLWQEVQTSGPKTPGKISNHTSVVHNDKMYVYGGCKNSGDCNENMYRLDLKTFRWEQIDQQG
jgi:Kelch motif